MQRKDFLKLIPFLPLTAAAMKLNELNKMTGSFTSTPKMPVLFLGHGSPMNAIEQNEFSKGWENIGKTLPAPSAILCVSAHWETKGTFVTAMEKPETIHDFGGFPKELFDLQYPAPGSPELANETKNTVKKTMVALDQSWGLDHGCWSVVKHLYPNANIPVIQLSLDRFQSPQYHYDLAKELAPLREKGILIIGSGNMVHNLRIMNWNTPETGFDWALEANATLKKLIMNNDHQQVIKYDSLGKSLQLAVPTPEHFLPLLYTLGLKAADESVSFFNDKTIMGSISMTSLKIGKS
ncbi:MAG TPA: 4,5-DOPA dioxygenase extradiol [Chitinophagales bacterium]|nr:4,5-DOPA dioxygenase extradiol [Chitinophagales bacterium]